MNPAITQIDSYTRRIKYAGEFNLIDAQIQRLFESDMITYPEEAELIEAIIRITESIRILEIGTYTGFASLHMIRAVLGRFGGHVTSIDFNPCHDRVFFTQFNQWFTFIEGRSPDILAALNGPYSLVFIDSSHDPVDTAKEVEALQRLICRGSYLIFHDVPRIKTLDAKEDSPIRQYINGLIASHQYDGMIFPSPRRLDLERVFGKGYSKDLSPHLAVLVKR